MISGMLGRPGRVLLIGMVILLGGCSFWGDDDVCTLAEEYQQAQLAPDLSIPPGLDQPDSANRLNVPAGPLPEQPLSSNAGCLQRPPGYFDKPLKENDK